MKLNKVLALALSGVMAVSMLAGCSGNPGNGGQEGEGETNVTGFAATVASKLDENKDNVTVTSSDTIDAALKAAMVKVADSHITGNRATASLTKVGKSGVVFSSLDDALSDITFSENGFTYASKDNADEDVNRAVIYYIGGDINSDRVAQLVADEIDEIELPERSKVNEKDGTYYAYDYTVDVSCATATTKDGTASLNYIVVVLNQNVSEHTI